MQKKRKINNIYIKNKKYTHPDNEHEPLFEDKATLMSDKISS